MTTSISDGFWRDRLDVNARRAIFHQWDQLEASGCIENFRIAAGDVDGFREGWFFADSDAHKWLDAASRIYASQPDPELAARIDAFIALLARAQQPDGYLFTYNQIHFPNTRWTNLQIEHELYCHGHLIEAGVSHFQATGRADLLDIARRAADRIVDDFRGKGADHTPGHEEIEIALLRLYQVTDEKSYLEMARQFIEQRGQNPFFAFSLLKQNSSVEARGKTVKQKKHEYLAAHPEFKPFQLPPGNAAKKPWNATLRWQINALNGKYFQQHAPVRKQTVPVGHSVRFAYLETAIAMLARETGDQTLVPALERAWEHMVTRRMYVTGGIGSLPALEGFGNDYELDPEYAYAETCAALASMFWNWEMVQLTHEAKYSDLFEWQLYNAAAVGMGADGTTYLYNNPLTCRGGVTRKPWYAVPCCPSNLSRTWADLGKYIYSKNENQIYVHQYINSETTLDVGIPVKIKIASELPWNGKVLIHVDPSENREFKINVRIPSWSPSIPIKPHESVYKQMSAQGTNFSHTVSWKNYNNSLKYIIETRNFMIDSRRAWFALINRTWAPGDIVELNLNMSIQLRRAHPKVKGLDGKYAIIRGPLVYCLESIDNPSTDIFNVKFDPTSLKPIFDASLLGGVMKIEGKSQDGHPLTFIPYHLWGNRGASTMTVWVNAYNTHG
ncbi:MAG: glycoside hydrolase family 127 protein [Chloroflexi bacterium]|nr:glycoside hydrolase family 127 protein [Chloroflexota bacterium]